jgi:hypothetical protein
MTEHFFDGNREGYRRALRKLAAGWVKYIAHLAAFFVAPVVISVSDTGTTAWLVGITAILAICVLDILPEAAKVAWDKTLDLDEAARIVALLGMAFVLLGATLMFSSLTEVRGVGSLIWILGHVTTLGGPPRLEKVSK